MHLHCLYRIYNLEFQAMNMQTIINYSLILIGAIIILVSLVRVRGLLKSTSTVPEYHQKQIKLFFVLHRELMVLFFVGYISVLVAFAFHYSFVSETFVSFIFFSGSIFVYIGTVVQSRLLAGMQNTLKGTLPICNTCKKIRILDRSSETPEKWQGIETYISEKTDVNFSHGYCPECFDKVTRNISVK
jgi:hypothetical protein